MAGELLAADDAGERRADEADADEGDLLETVGPAMAFSFSGIRRARRRRRGWPLRCRWSCAARWESRRRRRGAGYSRATVRKASAAAAECLPFVGKMDEHEIADARRDPQAELRQFFGQPGQPVGHCARRCVRHGRGRAIAAAPASIAAALTLNGPRMRFMRVDDVRRRVHPADAHAAEAMHLREGARHHDVLRRRDQLDARSRSRCGGHIRHRPRRAPEARSSAAPHAAGAPPRTAHRCRSDCWGWRGRRSSSSPSPRRGSHRHRRARRSPSPTTGTAPAAWM